MDPGTLVGIGLALAAIFGSMIMEGGNPVVLFAPSPLLLVFVGTLGVGIAGGLLKEGLNMFKVLKSALLTKPLPPDKAIEQVVFFAETARKEGLLALEEAARNIEDDFIKKGIQMAVDGIDPEEVQEILEGDISSMQERHKHGAKFFSDLGGYAPTLGILGTVIGLVHVLGHLSSPNSLGPMIASAFTATLWGVLSANVFWIPISNKLKRASSIEVRNKELILDGILAIQAGGSPRMIEKKLLSYLPPSEREIIQQRKKAA